MQSTNRKLKLFQKLVKKREKQADKLPPPPRRLTLADKDELEAQMPPEERDIIDTFWNDWVDENEAEIDCWQKETLYEIGRQGERQEIYQKPFLTVAEAASLIGRSESRLRSIMSELWTRKGKRVPFVVTAGGTTRMMIDREKFIEWVRSSKKSPGRLPKDGG